MNRGKQKNNSSGFKGVSLDKRCGRWKAEIRKEKKRFYLGYFSTAEIAYTAYLAAAKKLHGNFAYKDMFGT